MRNKLFNVIFLLLILLFVVKAQAQTAPKPLRIGFSISIANMTPEKMAYAKSVGVDCVEASLGYLLDEKEMTFKFSDEEAIAMVKQAKKAVADAGIEIWSIHMPYSKKIDLSLADEAERQKVITLQKKMLEYCHILKPKIILFHPSFFLGLNERELRKTQMIKSATELNTVVQAMHATMVIENMLGYQLLLYGGTQERLLCRTVEETVEIMNRLPKSIYSAIDLNHIKNPEKLILAMGPRLKTLHVSDGTGEKECHYFPCAGKGENNWTAILFALQAVHYTGPFMYESQYTDVKDFKTCYYSLYNEAFKAEKK